MNSSSTTKQTCAVTDDKITLWTELTPTERNKGARWFASRPQEQQAAVLLDCLTRVLPRLQLESQDKSEQALLSYTAFIVSVREAGFDLIRKRGYRVAGHREFAKFDSLRQGTLNSLRNKKKAPLRKELLAHWGDIRTLKEGKTGFLLISRYMQRAHRIKVSPAYIAKLWKEIEGSHEL